MHRYALQYLEEKWFVDPSRKPLLLRGARQVGKTWLARVFAKQKELTLVELNFERNPELKNLFESNDPRVVLRNIESYMGISIKLDKSLLFLDEIQDAPEVLSKLRWFYEEIPELPVIAAGSLLEFVLSDHSFSMPVGRISYLYVEPLSFEEFLLALEEDQLLNYIKTIELPFNIPDAIHQKLRGLFNLYCFVGGMPACVVKWIETKTFLDIAPIQEDLIATYRDDFYKYKGRLDVSRLLSVLSSIPNQLGQKFMYSRTGSDMQANVAKQILRLFNKAKITHTVKLSSANTVPLSSEIKDKAFKQIFLDVGLVNRMLSKPFQHSIQNTTKDGGISEQVVGQMLRTLFPVYKEPALYYWLREEQGASSEIDYLIEHNGEVVPVEVKSGSTGSLKSLHYFMYHKQKKLAVRINDDLPSITEVDVRLPTQESVSYTLLSIPFYLTSQIPIIISRYFVSKVRFKIQQLFNDEVYSIATLVQWYKEYLRLFIKEGAKLTSSSKTFSFDAHEREQKEVESYLESGFKNFLESTNGYILPDDQNSWSVDRDNKRMEEEVVPIFTVVMTPQFYKQRVISKKSRYHAFAWHNDVVLITRAEFQENIEAVKFCGQNEALGYDALFRNSSDRESKIEVTLAGIGHQQGLKKEKLNQDGIVILDEEFKKDGKSVARPLQYINEHPIAKRQAEVSTEWISAFKKKNKQAGRAGQSLIIGYKRVCSFDEDALLEEVNAFMECLESLDSENQFHSIYLVRFNSCCIQDKLLADASDNNNLH
jgi:predicted AAA+ superfamily ATPase